MPGYLFLVNHQTQAQLNRYTHDLYQIVAPLHPLVIYLYCDVSVAMSRAIHRSGSEWLNALTQRLDRGRFTFHPRTTVQNQEAPIAFFETVDKVSVELLKAEWPGTLLELDMMTSLDAAKAELTEYFGL